MVAKCFYACVENFRWLIIMLTHRITPLFSPSYQICRILNYTLQLAPTIRRPDKSARQIVTCKRAFRGRRQKPRHACAVYMSRNPTAASCQRRRFLSSLSKFLPKTKCPQHFSVLALKRHSPFQQPPNM